MAPDPVVAVALSGGIDSLVAGYLVKRRFKNVFGVHFTTGYETRPLDTGILEDTLGFDVLKIDLSQIFEDKIVRYFIDTYLEGRTPNPCIMCNRHIKFGALLDHALNLGADCLATGHYARINNLISCPDRKTARPFLEKGKDRLKDQSYFLCLLSCDQLEKIILPLGNMTKDQVKKTAASSGLEPVHSKESQDICFVPGRNFSQFIIENHGVRPGPGPVIDMQGRIIGRHCGLHQFTVGQRRGINCPGPEPYYVKSIDMQNNALRVCFKKDLFSETLNLETLNWNFTPLDVVKDVTTKIRYGHKGALSTVFPDNDRARVRFHEPQSAVTPGQAAAFYKDSRLIGGGIIT